MRIRGYGVVEDNEITGAGFEGIVVMPDAAVTLTGDTSCDNGEDLSVSGRADPQVDGTNTFCHQASADD